MSTRAHRILLALDGPQAAHKALSLTAECALWKQSQVSVISAFTPLPHHLWGLNLSRVYAHRIMEGRDLVLAAARRLASLGVAVLDPRFVVGQPRDVYVTAAREDQADLMVLAMQAGPGWSHVLAGGVNSGIAYQVPCPVLFVRP